MTSLNLLRALRTGLLITSLSACEDSGTPLPTSVSAPSAVPSAPTTESDTSTPMTRETVIDSPLIPESSGLARSQRDAKVLWTHNDSGGNAEGFAIDTNGKLLGTLSLAGGNTGGTPITVQALDWEDMASFTRNGQPFLVFADIGDNGAFRPNITLYVVAEPDLTGVATPFAMTVTPTQVISANYPDGPRDAEGLAVDGDANTFYIVSKRDAQPMLYSGALGATAAAPAGAVVMTNLGQINIPRAATDAESPERINWTTAFDFNQTLDEALVLTLTRAYRYPRALGESWFAAMSRAPMLVQTPQYSQSEAISYGLDSQSFFITSENAPFPLAEVPLR